MANLGLGDNVINGLNAAVFDSLASLEELRLHGNRLATLPDGVFDGLTSLLHLRLDDNKLSSLPDGAFDALMEELTELQLQDNTVDPILLPVRLDPVDNDGFKAVIPAGAPFDIVLPVAVTHGSIEGGATTLTISSGDTESPTETVAEEQNATDNPAVSIGTLPGIPDDHSGYALSKATSTAVTIRVVQRASASVALSSNPGVDETYATGDVITVEMTLDASVQVNTTGGTPHLALTIGSNTRNATYSGIDTTNRVLTFSYTVVSADSDQNGVSIVANAVSLNGGTIRATGTTEDAAIDHAAVTHQRGHLVNQIPRIISGGVMITSSPASGDTYRLGETISFSVTFNSDVVVDTTGGTPLLTVHFLDGSGIHRHVDFDYVSGTGGRVLEFAYVVQSGDRDASGVSVASNDLYLDEGTIRHSTTGKDANLQYQYPGTNGEFPGHKVDGTPVVPGIKLCGADMGPSDNTDLIATVDICWEVGSTIPTGSNAIIEVSRIYNGDAADSLNPPWAELARGDTYTPCAGGGISCVQITDGPSHGFVFVPSAPFSYRMRIRQGSSVLETSPTLYPYVPIHDTEPLNAELVNVLLPNSDDSYANQVATGVFRTDLAFGSPRFGDISAEEVMGLEQQDFAATNGVVTRVEPYQGAYLITVTPITLGQPVTVQLPANRVLGVGEGISSDGENVFSRNNNASNILTVETAAP